MQLLFSLFVFIHDISHYVIMCSLFPKFSYTLHLLLTIFVWCYAMILSNYIYVYIYIVWHDSMKHNASVGHEKQMGKSQVTISVYGKSKKKRLSNLKRDQTRANNQKLPEQTMQQWNHQKLHTCKQKTIIQKGNKIIRDLKHQESEQ